MKYMSVITNFGCHYKCPYCIVKENNLHIPKTTLAGLDSLREALKTNRCNIISISGGGDPLHEYDKHIEWYRKFFGITQSYWVNFDDRKQSIPVEMHTSYMTDETSFPFYDCYRVVYHANTLEQLSHIRRTGNEIVRAVFVVTAEYTISCNPNLQRKCRTTLTGVLQILNVRMDTKKGFLQRRAFFTISINGKEVQKSE